MTQLSLLGISFGEPLFIMFAAPVIVAFIFLNKNVIKDRKKAALVAVRSLVIIILFFTLASPYATKEEEVVQDTTSILAIEDQTDSMSMCESSLAADVVNRLRDRMADTSRIELLNMSSANKTAIGDTLYQGILGSSMKNNVIILASDGQNNYGADPLDVASFAAGANTRIFSILPKVFGNEAYVLGITGAEKTPVNSKYTGTVVIGILDPQASYSLRVMIDGVPALDTPVVQTLPKKEFSFERVFNTKGPHNITAQIVPESDTFSQNNVFNKVVNVIERPKVLLVTSGNYSPLRQVIEEIYDVDVVSTLPGNIDYYSTIVLDDRPSNAINTDEIRKFLNDGGGLLVVGGNSSYGEGGYYDSQFEGLLPVKSKEAPKKKGDKINVLILIDISGSTGSLMGGDTKIDIEKAIAVKMVRGLSKYAEIGVAAFNADSFLIQPIRKMTDTAALEDKISRLEFGGGTYVVTGLRRAEDMLSSVSGSKYVILISDGVTNYPVQAFEKGAALASKGIIIDTIGVGFDTDESFMKGLASRGRGIYFAPSETERVSIVIGNPDETETGEGGFSMVVTDAHHFITEGLGISNVSIKNFNEVTEKSSAQVLAATSGGKPLLTVWRFGLGRVAALTTDDGIEWANRLYTEGNSKLISSTVNWAIGDPEKKNDLRIDCLDTHLGEDAAIVVVSKKEYPKVSVGSEEVKLTRMDDTNYYFTYYPESSGFVSVSSPGYSCAMAVNYAEEYGSLGVNGDLLAAMANVTGGRVYLSDDMQSLVDAVSEYTVSESTGVSVKKINMQAWFTLAALIVFFIDITIRRIKEIRQSKHGK